jgi:hypothetical protein
MKSGTGKSKGELTLKKHLKLLGNSSVIGLAVLSGIYVGRLHSTPTTVHAQDYPLGSSTCVAIVPKAWGEFKGGSSYGLAFQDPEGRIRFVLHPPCGGAIVNGTQEPASTYVALELRRK